MLGYGFLSRTKKIKMASNMTALNPDRATLNFLNSFPEAARKRGEHHQEEGAVTQNL